MPDLCAAVQLLNQVEAQALDISLMKTPGFSIDQVPLPCSLRIAAFLFFTVLFAADGVGRPQRCHCNRNSVSTCRFSKDTSRLRAREQRVRLFRAELGGPCLTPRVFSHRGDGLVAARHLKHFGYHPTLFYPKRSTKGDAARLFSVCAACNVRL